MCPASEIGGEFRGKSNFEQDSNGQGFENMAIKIYKRSAADYTMNDPQLVRHPKILYFTACYMRDCLVD